MISVPSVVAEGEGGTHCAVGPLALESSLGGGEAAELVDGWTQGQGLHGALHVDGCRLELWLTHSPEAWQCSLQLLTPELELQGEKFRDFEWLYMVCRDSLLRNPHNQTLARLPHVRPYSHTLGPSTGAQEAVRFTVTNLIPTKRQPRPQHHPEPQMPQLGNQSSTPPSSTGRQHSATECWCPGQSRHGAGAGVLLPRRPRRALPSPPHTQTSDSPAQDCSCFLPRA